MTQTSDPKLDVITCNVEGKLVELNITDRDHPDNRLHGIKLLWTDFLNDFVTIGDFEENSFKLLQQFKKPVELRISYFWKNFSF